jgi:hypothetical protein
MCVMPKRKMTAARILQINQWQIAGSKARRSVYSGNTPRITPRATDMALWQGKKIIPTGKNTLLYHRTNSHSAAEIMKSRKWISGARFLSGRRGYSWFSKGGPTGASGYYGSALLTVKVPRKAVFHLGYNNQDGVDFVQVKNSVLKGRPVTRWH